MLTGQQPAEVRLTSGLIDRRRRARRPRVPGRAVTPHARYIFDAPGECLVGVIPGLVVWNGREVNGGQRLIRIAGSDPRAALDHACVGKGDVNALAAAILNVEMEMRAGGAIAEIARSGRAGAAAAGVADLIAPRQELALFNILADLGRGGALAEMCIPIKQTIIWDMTDDELGARVAGRASAVRADLFHYGDDTAAHGDNRTADRHGDINRVRAVFTCAGGPGTGDEEGRAGGPGKSVRRFLRRVVGYAQRRRRVGAGIVQARFGRRRQQRIGHSGQQRAQGGRPFEGHIPSRILPTRDKLSAFAGNKRAFPHLHQGADSPRPAALEFSHHRVRSRPGS